MGIAQPRLLVFSSLFPSGVQPGAGLFIRERMFRVGKHVPIVVVAPQPWFPGQALLRWVRPHFRPMALTFEIMDGVAVHRPRFFCIPAVFKWTDGLFMALSSFFTVRRIAREHNANLIDAHFGYPDGYAAVLLGRWLKLPVIITLRGKEAGQAFTSVARALKRAITGADQLITVSAALQAFAIEQGARPPCVQVIGNGVDLAKFSAVPRADARRQLRLPQDAEVLVSVGSLVEGKGFHRVIECLPPMLAAHPKLHLMIIGGAGIARDFGGELKRMTRELRLDDKVHFLGPIPHERLNVPLSAANAFVLATSYEGWANVFLEAMACGLPVVTTDVGGNAEVVNGRSLGRLVPVGDARRLQEAISEALRITWDRQTIRAYAESNSWDARMQPLINSYQQVLLRTRTKHAHTHAEIHNVR
ncbi:MAG: glycosyltransferase [Pseudomonadota bacterium]|nr:glycosyltransferase [Pseudomonadota bacterium]